MTIFYSLGKQQEKLGIDLILFCGYDGVVINVEDAKSIGCLASIPLSWQHPDNPLSTIKRNWKFVQSLLLDTINLVDQNYVPLITAEFQHHSDRPVQLQTQQSITTGSTFPDILLMYTMLLKKT